MKKLLQKTILAGMLSLSLPALAEISVVVHPSNSSDIKKEEITRIFLGKAKSFSGGGSVVPLNLKEQSIRTEFNKGILKKSDSQLKAYWSKLIFTGKGTPPKEVDSEEELLKLISTNPSLIGYVDSSKVTDNVKVVMTF